MREFATFNLSEILPESIAQDANVQAMAATLDEAFRKSTAFIPNVSILPNVRTLTNSALIDLLAWQFHADFYDQSLPLETRRTMVAKALDWHFRKGTPSVVEEVVATVFDDAKVTEWFEYGGDPYYFRISTYHGVNDIPTLQAILAAVWEVKNTRSWLDFVQAIVESWLMMYHAVGEYVLDEVNIGIRPVERTVDRPLHVGVFDTTKLAYVVEAS